MVKKKVKKYLVRNKSTGIVVKKRHQAKGINCRGASLNIRLYFNASKVVV